MNIILPHDCLVILCGTAGCGKSTFARRRFKQSEIVESDHCRAMICDSPAAQWCSPGAFELFHLIISRRMQYQRLTVADSTAVSKSARANLRRLARNYNRPVVLVAFKIPVETCIEWDCQRERRVGEDVISKQAEEMERTLATVDKEDYNAVYYVTPDNIGNLHVRRQKRE